MENKTNNANTKASKDAQANAESTARNENAAVPNNGLGYNGEFRIGRITIATGGDGSLRLRHSNDGSETEVAENVIEGVLEEAFFQRVIDEDGTDRKGTATK